MKPIQTNIDKYKKIINKPKKQFIPNKTDVDLLNTLALEWQRGINSGGSIDYKHKNNSNGEYDKYRVNIMVYVDSNADKYFKYCEYTFVEWCNNMGYTLTIVRKENNLNSYVTWKKIDLLREAVVKKTHDIVAIVDADVIINNTELDLKSYIKRDKLIYASSDGENGNSVVNTGFLFVLCSDETERFLDNLWKQRNGKYANKPYHEQTVISEMYTSGYYNIIEVLGMRELNSFYLDDKYNRPNNNVYHFMARSLKHKVDYVKSHFNIK